MPPLPPPEIEKRLAKVKEELKQLFKNGNKTKVKKNLTSFQDILLRNLQKQDSVVIANSDKNLGPVAVKLKRYNGDALVHLNDEHIRIYIRR